MERGDPKSSVDNASGDAALYEGMLTETLLPVRRRNVWKMVVWAASTLAALVLFCVAAAVIWGPGLARDEVEGRINTLSSRLGYTVGFGSMEVLTGNRVVLRDVRVSRPASTASTNLTPLAKLPRVEVEVDLLDAIFSAPDVVSVELFSPALSVIRIPDGSTDLDPVLKMLRERSGQTTEHPARKSQGRRRPSVHIVDGQVSFRDQRALDVPFRGEAGGPLAREVFPASTLRNVTLTLPRSEEVSKLTLTGTLEVSSPNNGMTPRDLKATLERRAEGWSIASSFSPAIRVAALPGAPRIAASVGGVAFTMPGTLVATELRLELAGQQAPLLTAERLEVAVKRLTTKLDQLEIERVEIGHPTVHIEAREDELTSLSALLRRLSQGAERQGSGTSGRVQLTPTPDVVKSTDSLDPEMLEKLLERAPAQVAFKEGQLSLVMLDGEPPVRWDVTDIRGFVEHEAQSRRVRVDVALSPGFRESFALKGFYGYGASPREVKSVEVELALDRVDIASPLHRFRPELATVLPRGALSGDLAFVLPADGTGWKAELDLQSHDVEVFHRFIASDTLKSVDCRVSARVDWDQAAGDLWVRDGRFTLEGVATLEGELGVLGWGHGDKRAPVDLKRVKLNVSMARTEAQSVFDAVPEVMRRELEGMTFAGSVGFNFSADVDARSIQRMKTSSDVDLSDFKILTYNKHADVRRLLTTFKHSTVQPKTGFVYNLAEDSEVWTPMTSVSPYVVKAIRTNEDGAFYSHNGFSWKSVKQSLEQNIRKGRYVRGASTVSMQLVKNIFLSPEKTMARKLQEAILTASMEQIEDVPKNRIMEVYLNIIEWGPGVYGIRNAAWHFFKRHPRNLRLAESVYLISILPGPRKYHAFYERGFIGDGWWNRMKRLLRIMADRRHISEEEYLISTERRPIFRKRGPAKPSENGELYDEDVEDDEVSGEYDDEIFEGEPGHYED